MRRGGFSGFLALFTACSLSTSLDGLSGRDGTRIDAPPDAAMAEDAAELPYDSGLPHDAGQATDGGTPSGCSASDAAFCVDFDNGDITSNWTALVATGASRLVLDSLLTASSPYALWLRTDTRGDAGNGCEYARPTRNLVDLGPHLGGRLAFRVWVGEANRPSGIVANQNVGALASESGCLTILSLGTDGCGQNVQYQTGCKPGARVTV